jgi:hypothetical protein
MSSPKIICDRPSPHRRDKFGANLIDYAKDDPFQDWPDPDVFACLDAALAADPQSVELATLIWKSLQNRQGDVSRAKKDISAAGGKLISWLPGVRYRVADLLKDFKYEVTIPRLYKVYFILLNEAQMKPPAWGIYIGQTHKKIEKRLAVHRNPEAKHGSSKVRKKGHQFLYCLCSLVPPMRKADSLAFEKLLLTSLRGETRRKPIKGLRFVRGG